MNLYEEVRQMIGNMYAMMDKIIGTEGFPYTHEEVLNLMKRLELEADVGEAAQAVENAANLLQNVVDNVDRIGGLDELKPNAFGEYDRAEWLLKNSMINVRTALKHLRKIVPSDEQGLK